MQDGDSHPDVLRALFGTPMRPSSLAREVLETRVKLAVAKAKLEQLDAPGAGERIMRAEAKRARRCARNLANAAAVVAS